MKLLFIKLFCFFSLIGFSINSVNSQSICQPVNNFQFIDVTTSYIHVGWTPTTSADYYELNFYVNGVLVGSQFEPGTSNNFQFYTTLNPTDNIEVENTVHCNDGGSSIPISINTVPDVHVREDNSGTRSNGNNADGSLDVYASCEDCCCRLKTFLDAKGLTYLPVSYSDSGTPIYKIPGGFTITSDLDNALVSEACIEWLVRECKEAKDASGSYFISCEDIYIKITIIE